MYSIVTTPSRNSCIHITPASIPMSIHNIRRNSCGLLWLHQDVSCYSEGVITSQAGDNVLFPLDYKRNYVQVGRTTLLSIPIPCADVFQLAIFMKSKQRHTIRYKARIQDRFVRRFGVSVPLPRYNSLLNFTAHCFGCLKRPRVQYVAR